MQKKITMTDSDSNHFPVQSKRAAAVYVYFKKKSHYWYYTKQVIHNLSFASDSIKV